MPHTFKLFSASPRVPAQTESQASPQAAFPGQNDQSSSFAPFPSGTSSSRLSRWEKPARSESSTPRFSKMSISGAVPAQPIPIPERQRKISSGRTPYLQPPAPSNRCNDYGALDSDTDSSDDRHLEDECFPIDYEKSRPGSRQSVVSNSRRSGSMSRPTAPRPDPVNAFNNPSGFSFGKSSGRQRANSFTSVNPALAQERRPPAEPSKQAFSIGKPPSSSYGFSATPSHASKGRRATVSSKVDTPSLSTTSSKGASRVVGFDMPNSPSLRVDPQQQQQQQQQQSSWQANSPPSRLRPTRRASFYIDDSPSSYGSTSYRRDSLSSNYGY